jgi:hypothetical protein
MLHEYGYTPADLIGTLEGFAHRCHLVDASSRGRLAPVTSDDFQPECVVEYLAFKCPMHSNRGISIRRSIGRRSYEG